MLVIKQINDVKINITAVVVLRCPIW